MIKRILFVLTFIPALLVLFICIYISLFILGPIALVKYIIKGDEADDIQDWMLTPCEWAMNLPWKITGMEV